jgi:integrase
MPKKTRIPMRRLHKATGQAAVTLNGKHYYLGPYDSDESVERYEELIADWLKKRGEVRRSPQQEPNQPLGSLSVNELILAYWKFAQSYYVKEGKQTDEVSGIKAAMKPLKRLYGQIPAEKFGPLALEDVRNAMIEKGNSRGYINQNIGRIRRMFRWALSKQLIPAHVVTGLEVVRDLSAERSAARETEPVLPVPNEVVAATLPELPQEIADMVRLQELTGMRPAEVCCIRPGDIDRSADVWQYVPRSHKMKHKGRKRIIFIGPKAQAILAKYLFRDADAPCFPKGDDKAHTTTTYRTAIHRGCKRTWPAPDGLEGEKLKAWHKHHQWNPNQLRHNAATLIRKEHGLEAAQVILGHSQADTTQIYAERDLALAAATMQAVG